MTIYQTYKSVNKDEAIKIWSHVILDLTDKQIINALEVCATDTSNFAPSPAIFKLWAYGLPDEDMAYFHAEKKQYPSPEIYHAANQAGMLDKHNQFTANQTKEKFKLAYKNTCQRRMAGETFNFPIQDKSSLLEQKDPSGNNYRLLLISRFGPDHPCVKEFEKLSALNYEQLQELRQEKLEKSDIIKDVPSKIGIYVNKNL